MNERLVFFCDRDQRPCYLYRWGATEGGSSYLYQVYCKAVLEHSPPAQSEQKLNLAGLADQVAAAGGGLVAETQQTGDMMVLSVQIIPAAGYQTPKSMVVLAPGQDPKQAPIEGRGMTLTAGELALVPATADDEANLAALIKHLERLPGDYRRLVLDVLRQPGIDGTMRRLTLRINELLERLGEMPAEGPEASGQNSRHTEPLAQELVKKNWMHAKGEIPTARIEGFWPRLLAGLVILNLAGLAAGAWLLPGKTAREIQRAVVPTDLTGEPLSPQAAPDQTTAGPDCEAHGGESPWQSLYAFMLKAQDDRFQVLAGTLEDCESKIASATTTGASAPAQSNDPKQAINDLIETWMIHAYGLPKDDTLRIVAEAHFSAGNNQAIYTPDWLTADDGDNAEAGFKRRERIAYAIAKLILIKNDISIPNAKDTLKDADARTNTKKAMKIGLTAKDNDPQLDDDDRQLLAWVACGVFPSDRLANGAQFIQVDEEDPPDNDVDLELACGDVQADKVLAAIRHYRDALTSKTE